MEDKPSISVVIPCYNGAPYLRETLDSVLRQTYPVQEILVIDDGSTDNSAGLAESFGPPVRVIRQPNQGESVARNRGMDEARGEWIAFLDADDLWLPEKLAHQIPFMAHPATSAVCSGIYIFHGTDTATRTQEIIPQAEQFSLDWICSQLNNPIHTSSLIVRKGTQCRFPTWTKYAEDALFNLELLKKGKIEIVPEILVGYRRHPQNQSGRKCVYFDWHQSISRWLDQNADLFTKAQLGEIQKSGLDKIVEFTKNSLWNREFAIFKKGQHYLHQYPDHPGVKPILKKTVWPTWVYTMKDWVDSFR